MMITHTPVMKKEILDFLADMSLGIVFDGTCGGGGHAKEILCAHPEIVLYHACDKDVYALQKAGENLKEYTNKVSFLQTPFSSPPEGVFSAILLDLGVSSFQLDNPERGFSFMKEGPLDMRMDQSQDFSAEDIVNTWSREALAQLFFEYGEERKSRQVAAFIVERRRKKRFTTTLDLAECVAKIVPRRGRAHPATQVFQALRIAVNDELTTLHKAIVNLSGRLAQGGRMIILTFHSLEDRIVKHAFLELSRTGGFNLVIKKPLVPSRAEVIQNPRARSSKMRVLARATI